MKNNAAQQEVLLMTGTSFSTRQFDTMGTPDHSKYLTGNDQLKEACWNGLLKEMLPELFPENTSGSKLYLWQVRESNRFFMLKLGEYPAGVDAFLSIDPYRFMEVQCEN